MLQVQNAWHLLYAAELGVCAQLIKVDYKSANRLINPCPSMRSKPIGDIMGEKYGYGAFLCMVKDMTAWALIWRRLDISYSIGMTSFSLFLSLPLDVFARLGI